MRMLLAVSHTQNLSMNLSPSLVLLHLSRQWTKGAGAEFFSSKETMAMSSLKASLSLFLSTIGGNGEGCFSLRGRSQIV